MIDVPLLIGGGVVGLLFKLSHGTVRATVEQFLIVFLSFFFVTFLYLDLPARVGLELSAHAYGSDRPLNDSLWLLSLSLFTGFVITSVIKLAVTRHIAYKRK